MVAGNFIYGPADRLWGSRKWPVIAGNGAVAVLCLTFWVAPPSGLGAAVAIFALIGLLGASYPLVMSHGRSFCPPHLTGRGVTLLNLFGMGGAGVMQFATAPTYSALAQTRAPVEAYGMLFGLIGLAIIAGLAVYLWAKDSTG
jgi:nitrate/nitrite transporter NarK